MTMCELELESDAVDGTLPNKPNARRSGTEAIAANGQLSFKQCRSHFVDWVVGWNSPRSSEKAASHNWPHPHLRYLRLAGLDHVVVAESVS